MSAAAPAGLTIQPMSSSGNRPSFSAGRSSPTQPPFPTQKGLVDLRIKKIRPLIPPACLLEELPTSEDLQSHIMTSRFEACDIIQGRSDRLLVVVGPCSIHDPAAALEYAKRLKPLKEKYAEDLLICMRVYLEKPRTTVGWKGLINDPELDGSFAINSGLRVSRKLLLDLNEIGLPLASEMLDTITPQFMGDLITWGAIGARTTESQLHRELVSGLSFPIGFKNGTNGGMKVATDAMVASRFPHSFLGVTTQGVAAIIETNGNPDTHIVLRGGEQSGVNYGRSFVSEAVKLLTGVDGPIAIMIDCSHGNAAKSDGSGAKDHANQILVLKEVEAQLRDPSNPDAQAIVGVMIESNLVEGAQKLTCGPGKKAQLKYGQSVTDACIGWEHTEKALEELAAAVRVRRENNAKAAAAATGAK
jgi:3-deoxy-7-phosphoheptulonate synthase